MASSPDEAQLPPRVAPAPRGHAPSLPPVAPAVHHHGSGSGRASLGQVHLLQEAKDAGGLGRDPVVGPAEVLVMLHCAWRLLLGRASR